MNSHRILPNIQQTDFRKPPPDDWPAPPAKEAYHGLAGKVVDAVDPHSEADPVGVLVNLLGAVGNLVGAGVHFMIGATRHTARDNFVLVGHTSQARKGTSWDPIEMLLYPDGQHGGAREERACERRRSDSSSA